MQAQAYRMKDLYPQSIDSARAAIRLAPAAAEPHLWLAESLRLSAQYPDASGEYTEYLRLSDFDSKLAGKMNYYVLGFLAGSARRSARRRPTPGATCAAWRTSGCAIPSASRGILNWA